MSNPHPVIIHFPVALLTVALLFELLARFLRRDDFSRFGWWTQLSGSIGLTLAVVSGLFAKDIVSVATAAVPYFELHQQFAFASSGLFAVLLLWRIASRTRIPEKHTLVYLLLLALGVAVLWAGAWYGGEMVYRFGVGLRTG